MGDPQGSGVTAKKAAAKKAPARKRAAKKAAAKKPAVAEMAAPEATALLAGLESMLTPAVPAGRVAPQEHGDEFLRALMQELAVRIVDDFHIMLDEASPQIRQRMLMSAFSRMLAFAFEGATKKDQTIDEMRQQMMSMMQAAAGAGVADTEAQD